MRALLLPPADMPTLVNVCRAVFANDDRAVLADDFDALIRTAFGDTRPDHIPPMGGRL